MHTGSAKHLLFLTPTVCECEHGRGWCTPEQELTWERDLPNGGTVFHAGKWLLSNAKQSSANDENIGRIVQHLGSFIFLKKNTKPPLLRDFKPCSCSTNRDLFLQPTHTSFVLTGKCVLWKQGLKGGVRRNYVHIFSRQSRGGVEGANSHRGS